MSKILKEFVASILNEAERDRQYLKKINAQKIKRQNSNIDHQELARQADEGPIFSKGALEFIKEMDDNAFPENARKEYVKWFGNQLNNILIGYRIDAVPEGLSWQLLEKSHTLKDWIRATDTREWLEMNFDQAVEVAEQWHDQIKDSANDDASGSEGDEIVYKFKDGWTIKKLQACSLDSEGNLMGHCVGGYEEIVESGHVKIFSLRDPKNRPHVTIEIDDDNEVQQIKGKQNKTPIREYFVRVVEWLKASGYYYEDCSDYLDGLTAEEMKLHVQERFFLAESSKDQRETLRFLHRFDKAVANEVRVYLLELVLKEREGASPAVYWSRLSVLFESITGDQLLDDVFKLVLELDYDRSALDMLIQKRKQKIEDMSGASFAITDNDRDGKKLARGIRVSRDHVISIFKKYPDPDLLSKVMPDLFPGDIIEILPIMKGPVAKSGNVYLRHVLRWLELLNSIFSRAQARLKDDIFPSISDERLKNALTYEIFQKYARIKDSEMALQNAEDATTRYPRLIELAWTLGGNSFDHVVIKGNAGRVIYFGTNMQGVALDSLLDDNLPLHTRETPEIAIWVMSDSVGPRRMDIPYALDKLLLSHTQPVIDLIDRLKKGKGV